MQSSDFTQRWVVNDNWTYTADLTPILKDYNSAERQTNLLIFYGIDTVATIVSLRVRAPHLVLICKDMGWTSGCLGQQSVPAIRL